MRRLFLCALLLLEVPATARPRPSDGATLRPIPVLLITGENNHDWEWTSGALAAILSSDGRFEVEVTRTPAEDLARAQELARYRAFVLDYNGARWGAAAEENFLAAVRGGTGVAVVHAANNAFPGWREYEELVALCWREGTGHGQFHAFDVELTDRDHPITRGLPDLRGHFDELYHRLVPMHDAPYRVLATAYSDPEKGGTGQREPMILVRDYGKGRVFHTPLGHVWRDAPQTHASFEDEGFQNLIVRGVEWAATGRVSDGERAPNRLSALEQQAGWELLFDGESTDGWVGYASGEAPQRGWVVRDGCLVHLAGGGGGPIVTRAQFTDFELELEWKVAAGANSGIKYRVPPSNGGGGIRAPEYQILDDTRHRDGAAPKTRAGALYAVYEPDGALLARQGAFNRARIVARGNRLEHWVNGVRVVACEIGSEDWRERIAASKFRDSAGFAAPAAGAIALQDHGDEVWFRSIKVRDLAPRGSDLELFNGRDTDGWIALGDARYVADEGSLLGEVDGGSQSFLRTEREFGDFVLDVELKNEMPGNSGIQVRSHETDKGRLRGYQIEIDPSERAWSGGLYDEARRGWLDNLEDNAAGRAAFRPGEWNHYRIECIGPWIGVRVNGVATADYFDVADFSGVIGLQVHSGNNTRMRWRDLVLRPLGRHGWTELWNGERAAGLLERAGEWTPDGGVLVGRAEDASPAELHLDGMYSDVCLRIRYEADADVAFRVHLRDRGAPPRWSEQPAPGIAITETGWTVTPSELGLPAANGPAELVVITSGARLVLRSAGALLHDLRDLPGPSEGVVWFEAQAQNRGAEAQAVAIRLHTIELAGQLGR